MLMLAMRWIDRLFGFVSTLILARLLLPDDFGIVAQCSLVAGLIAVFTDLGVQFALVQNEHAEQSHFDTAWTVRLIQNVVVVIAIVAVAPLAAEYFADERVELALQVMAITVLLSGVENIGVVMFQKEMKFQKDFQFLFIRRAAGFVITIVLALLWQSYWAMIIGAISGRAVGVIASYLMHSMRPRLSFRRFSEIFSFSQWMLVQGIGTYFSMNLDRLIVGGQTDTKTVGEYTIAQEIAAMPTSELLAPINRVLFPAFVAAKHNLTRLADKFVLSQSVQGLVALPASVGLALVAEEAVLVLLGSKWTAAIPFIQVLAFAYIAEALSTSAKYVILTLGKAKLSALIVWVQLLVFVVLVGFTFSDYQTLYVAWIRVASTFVGLALVLIVLRTLLPDLTAWDLTRHLSRSVIAVFSMALIVTYTQSIIHLAPFPMLMAKILIGVGSYVSTVLLLWLAVGKPDGAEKYILRTISSATAKFRV